MTFENLHQEALKLWPESIDVSDGSDSGNGFLFEGLNIFWDNAEVKAKVLGEWYNLITWIIFGNLHDLAKEALQNGQKQIRLNQIDIQKMKTDLVTNLQLKEYEDMLLEFESDKLNV